MTKLSCGAVAVDRRLTCRRLPGAREPLLAKVGRQHATPGSIQVKPGRPVAQMTVGAIFVSLVLVRMWHTRIEGDIVLPPGAAN